MDEKGRSSRIDEARRASQRYDPGRVAQIIAMPGSSREVAAQTELSDRYIRYARDMARKQHSS